MTAVELTATQRSALVAINFKPSTVLAASQFLNMAKALTSNLLEQLKEAGLAKKYENGQYAVTEAGKALLNIKPDTTHAQPNKALVKKAKIKRPAVFNTPCATAESAMQQPSVPVAELIDVDCPNENPSEDLAALLAMSPTEQPDPVVVRAETETTAIITQLQTSKPLLPSKIESSLQQLEKMLHVPAIKPMADIDTKLQVLQRLADLLHPTIAEVLDAIADDLQRVQQVANDISKAA